LQLVYLLFLFIVSYVVTHFCFVIIIPRLKKAGIVGKNMNSEFREEIAEMGGLVIAIGFGAGIILAIALRTFCNVFPMADLNSVLAALATILIVTLIGIFDDLISIKQSFKAFLPVFAALPLMAIKEGTFLMKVPLGGIINFGIYYSLILIPAGITGAANAMNMLAGFNGLEVGMGLVAVGILAIIAYMLGELTAFIILIVTFGALLATLFYNWYPAKILIGDVGTMSIGAIVASAAIIGNFEMAGIIIIIPYAVDFLIKAKNRFPSQDWWGIYHSGKLYCPENGPVGLCQLIMKWTGGISERNLVLILMGIELIFGGIALLVYIY